MGCDTVTTCRTRFLALALLGEVGELVGAEDELLALGGVAVTLLVRGVNVGLNGSGFDGSEKTTFILNLEEELPSLLGQSVSQMLDVIRAGRGIDDAVEVAFLLDEQLLVAGDALAELCRLLIGSVERRDDQRVNTTEGGTHGLRLRTEQVDVGVEDRLIIG